MRWLMTLVFALALTLAAVCPPLSADESKFAWPFLTGKLLVAAPKLRDPNFAKTVVLMIEHDGEGAFGLIVNRIYGRGPRDKFFEGFGIEAENAEGDIQVHFGGPVELDRAWILHSPDYDGPGTVRLTEEIAITSQPSILEAMAHGKGPKSQKFIMGYAGWPAGQLEAELARGDWTSAPAEFSLIFSDDLGSVWERARGRSGFPL